MLTQLSPEMADAVWANTKGVRAWQNLASAAVGAYMKSVFNILSLVSRGSLTTGAEAPTGEPNIDELAAWRLGSQVVQGELFDITDLQGGADANTPTTFFEADELSLTPAEAEKQQVVDAWREQHEKLFGRAAQRFVNCQNVLQKPRTTDEDWVKALTLRPQDGELFSTEPFREGPPQFYLGEDGYLHGHLDGQDLTVRPAQETDAPGLYAASASQSEQERYTRFFASTSPTQAGIEALAHSSLLTPRVFRAGCLPKEITEYEANKATPTDFSDVVIVNSDDEVQAISTGVYCAKPGEVYVDLAASIFTDGVRGKRMASLLFMLSGLVAAEYMREIQSRACDEGAGVIPRGAFVTEILPENRKSIRAVEGAMRALGKIGVIAPKEAGKHYCRFDDGVVVLEEPLLVHAKVVDGVNTGSGEELVGGTGDAGEGFAGVVIDYDLPART
jgi:hypothetical protein